MTRRRDFRSQDEPSSLDEHALFQAGAAEGTESIEPEFADDEGSDVEPLEPETAEEPAAAEPIEVPARPLRRESRSGRMAAASTPVIAKLALGLGIVTTLAGALLLAGNLLAPAPIASLTNAMSAAGIAPAHLLLAGLLLAAAGGLRCRMAVSEQQVTWLASLAGESGERQQELGDAMQRLLEEMGSTDDSIESGGLHRIIHVLHRLDEKTNNLTRAFKMFGKPLVDVAKQVTQVEVAVREAQEAAAADLQAAGARTSDAERRWHEKLDPLTAATAELNAAIGRVADGVRALGERGADPRIAELTQGLRTLAGKLESSLDERFEALERKLDERSRAVAAGVEKLAAQPRADQELNSTLEAIRKDLAGLGQQIRSAGARGAAAPAPAPAPAASRSAPAASAPAASSGDGGPGGLAQSIAGSKTGSGQNVMSAIEKLKSLRK